MEQLGQFSTRLLVGFSQRSAHLESSARKLSSIPLWFVCFSPRKFCVQFAGKLEERRKLHRQNSHKPIAGKRQHAIRRSPTVSDTNRPQAPLSLAELFPPLANWPVKLDEGRDLRENERLSLSLGGFTVATVASLKARMSSRDEAGKFLSKSESPESPKCPKCPDFPDSANFDLDLLYLPSASVHSSSRIKQSHC